MLKMKLMFTFLLFMVPISCLYAQTEAERERQEQQEKDAQERAWNAMGLRGQELISRLRQGDKDGYTDTFDGDCKKIDDAREYCSRVRDYELEREFARNGIEYKKVIDYAKVEKTGWSTRAVFEFCGVAFLATTPLMWVIKQKFEPEYWAPAVLGILITGGSWLGRYCGV